MPNLGQLNLTDTRLIKVSLVVNSIHSEMSKQQFVSIELQLNCLCMHLHRFGHCVRMPTKEVISIVINWTFASEFSRFDLIRLHFVDMNGWTTSNRPQECTVKHACHAFMANVKIDSRTMADRTYREKAYVILMTCLCIILNTVNVSFVLNSIYFDKFLVDKFDSNGTTTTN